MYRDTPLPSPDLNKLRAKQKVKICMYTVKNKKES